MPVVDRHVISDITRALSSMRTSLDASTAYVRGNHSNQSAHEEAYFAFERVRFVFRSEVGRSRSRTSDDVYVDLDSLIISLESLINNRDYRTVFSSLKYRPFPAPREEGFRLHPLLLSSGYSVADAITYLIESIVSLLSTYSSAILQSDLFEGFRQLETLLPKEQKASPLRFTVRNNRISVESYHNRAVEQNRAAAEEAQDELSKRGNRLVEDLKRSNCDPRLVSGLQDLQQQLISQKDIVRLGLANIGLDLLCEKLSSEIPDALSASLKAHTVGVNLYINQFPEWQRFTEQAAETNLQRSDVPHLKSSVTSIVSYVEQHPSIAEPEVPSLFKAINDSLVEHSADISRYTFAAWRSLENFIVTACKYGFSLARRTGESIDKQLPDAIGKVVVRGLMAAALAGLVWLSPIAGHLPDGGWLIRATELVKAQIERLS